MTGKRVVRFNVYQGESRLVRDNIHLGSIEVPVPSRSAREVRIDVRFTYDINGLLEVDLTVPSIGEARQLVIVGDDQMSQEELAKRRAQLAKLKVHPRDDVENRAALTRASRCYEQFLGDTRELIGRLMLEFERVLERQDPRDIEHARTVLHEHLDQIEGERYL